MVIRSVAWWTISWGLWCVSAGILQSKWRFLGRKIAPVGDLVLTELRFLSRFHVVDKRKIQVKPGFKLIWLKISFVYKRKICIEKRKFWLIPWTDFALKTAQHPAGDVPFFIRKPPPAPWNPEIFTRAQNFPNPRTIWSFHVLFAFIRFLSQRSIYSPAVWVSASLPQNEVGTWVSDRKVSCTWALSCRQLTFPFCC